MSVCCHLANREYKGPYFLFLELEAASDAQSGWMVKWEGSCLLAVNMEPFVVVPEFERCIRCFCDGSLFFAGLLC